MYNNYQPKDLKFLTEFEWIKGIILIDLQHYRYLIWTNKDKTREFQIKWTKANFLYIYILQLGEER